MKKILNILILLLILPIFVYAEDITITNITKIDSSEYSEDEEVIINEQELNFKTTFNNINQYIKYKIDINNPNDEDYTLSLTNDENSVISYELSDTKIEKNKTNSIELKIYSEEFDDSLTCGNKNSNDELKLKFTKISSDKPIDDSEDIQKSIEEETPNTGDKRIIIYISLLIIASIALVIISIKKNKKYLRYLPIPIVAIGLLIIPYAFSINDSEFTLKNTVEFNLDCEKNMLAKVEYHGGVYASSIVSTPHWSDYHETINKVVIEDEMNEPETYVEKYDVSVNGDNSVLAYIIEDATDSTKYILLIMADGKIRTNYNSQALFANLNYVNTIEGLENLDTNLTTNMSYMFYEAGYNSKTFDIGDLSSWDISNVTNLNNMFYKSGCLAKTFNIGDLSKWDTSNVTDMSFMFTFAGQYNNTTFDISGISNWDTSNVTNMHAMFESAGTSAREFKMDLSNWNTSNVKNMGYMFDGAGYDSKIFEIGDLSNWDTSNVFSMYAMFHQAGYSAKTFDIGNLNNWDTSKVTHMRDLFGEAGYSANTFNIGDLSNWDTSNVTNMVAMFSHAGYSATTFDIGNLDSWDTSNVNDMYAMFYNAGRIATTFNIGNLNDWDTSNVTDMTYMFNRVNSNLTLDLSGWNVNKVKSHLVFTDSTNIIEPIWVK